MPLLCRPEDDDVRKEVINDKNIMQKISSIRNQNKNQHLSGSFLVQKRPSSFFRPAIQPKLSINQPNDIYEREADAVADKVMRMTNQETTQAKFFRPVISSVQRKCTHCEEEEKKMQRKEMNGEEANLLVIKYI